MQHRPKTVAELIERWAPTEAHELANFQPFMLDLCAVLGLESPDGAMGRESLNDYTFYRHVTLQTLEGDKNRFIDLYRRGCFVMEAKQGSNIDGEEPAHWPKDKKRGTGKRGLKSMDDAMVSARSKCEVYAKALPAEHGWPPFLIVCDIGHVFEVWADFSGLGKSYRPFPDTQEFRISLTDLLRPEKRKFLADIWNAPFSLDPQLKRTEVTTTAAETLGDIARLLENDGHPPGEVAAFLMRIVFSCFAQSVGLLPEKSFTELLRSLKSEKSATRQHLLKELWSVMDRGGISSVIRSNLKKFNGGLFNDPRALPLTEDQIGMLVSVSEMGWQHVEPAIFGTLLERVLGTKKRKKLGAFFTPRSYVEKLINATMTSQLRSEWRATEAAVVSLLRQGKKASALDALGSFRSRLTSLRVLDPACGTGNFLYVALDHFCQIEEEVIRMVEDIKEQPESEGPYVQPAQFLGLECNPRAAAIADIVLWIGYLQCHRRSARGQRFTEPILKNNKNILYADALLESEGTTKQNVIDLLLEDPSAAAVAKLKNAKRSKWPACDFIIGNPPFLGNKKMKSQLGKPYVEALRAVHDEVPKTSDLVMYWWNEAARLLAAGKVRRFGFITTKSLSQTSNRGVVKARLRDREHPIYIKFCIPNHPWKDKGASVRICMTVAEAGSLPGVLEKVAEEDRKTARVRYEKTSGKINANLTVGTDLTECEPLQANKKCSFQGVTLVGEGFRLTHAELATLGIDPARPPEVVKRYLMSHDLMQGLPSSWVIDFHGYSKAEAKDRFPKLYDRIYSTVRPERLTNDRAGYREKWWLFGENRLTLRKAIKPLSRFIVVAETSTYKPFIFVPSDFVIDHKLYCISSDDSFHLGVLSSSFHQTWLKTAGGKNGVGDDPTWTNTTCFEPFPFPDCKEKSRNEVRAAADSIERLRQEILRRHGCCLTDIYNAVFKKTAGAVPKAALADVDKLRLLHDELDEVVAIAYGFDVSKVASATDVLEFLHDLNLERRRQERIGNVVWLTGSARAIKRLPKPTAVAPEAMQLVHESLKPVPSRDERIVWPDTEAARYSAILGVLSCGWPMSPEKVAAHFDGPRDTVNQVTEALLSMTYTNLVVRVRGNLFTTADSANDAAVG